MGKRKRQRILADYETRLAAIAAEFEARIDACIARAATAAASHPVLCTCAHCTARRISGHRIL